KLLRSEGVDLIFYPDCRNMYKEGFSTFVEEKRLSRFLCGQARPGHFKGVCTVLVKLFNIVSPDIAYLGSKDYQQAQIVKKMAADLDFSLKIKVLPIVREKNGLAMSSRNAYLSREEKDQAGCLYRALITAKKLVAAGETMSPKIITAIRRIILSEKHIRVDYIRIVDATTLENKSRVKGKVLVALAVYISGVRLIDNIVLNGKKVNAGKVHSRLSRQKGRK
ncbi:MAG: pantoate--beta-alanine ligase, partial [Candidatus Omnitrophica bacterium]|nr:pantoate--beta-alanine ligase [Candidatus Omnitrophota bacterium]